MENQHRITQLRLCHEVKNPKDCNFRRQFHFRFSYSSIFLPTTRISRHRRFFIDPLIDSGAKKRKTRKKLGFSSEKLQPLAPDWLEALIEVHRSIDRNSSSSSNQKFDCRRSSIRFFGPTILSPIDQSISGSIDENIDFRLIDRFLNYRYFSFRTSIVLLL